MRPKKIDLTFLTPALDNVAADQTTGGAADLTIDGSLSANGAVVIDTAHRLDFESAGDIQTVTFTITGTNAQGDAITDTVTGINASTVTTTEYFKTITQIAADGAVGTNVSVGTTDECESQIIPLNHYASNFQVGLFADVSGTVNYTLQHTGDNVLAGDVPTWFNHDTMATQTGDADGNYVIPVAACKLVVNSYSAGCTLSLDILQSK